MNQDGNNKLITVVVPIYNIEEYIEKCIKTILIQSYKKLEIILIDDGSTDNSGKICDSYENKDRRIKVIHKKNGGLSDARNLGIRYSNGDFITFIDGDDYVDKDYIKVLYDSIIIEDADVSICEFSCLNRHNKQKNHPIASEKRIILNQKESIEVLLRQKPFSNSACGKLYKTSLFNNICFPVNRLYEDTATIYKVFLKSNKFVFVSKVLYFYIRREHSITNSSFSINKMDCLYFAEKMIEDVLIRYPDLRDQSICRLMDPCIELLPYISPYVNPHEYMIVWEKVKSIRRIVLMSKYATRKRRFFAAISFLGNRFFGVIAKLISLR